MHTGHIKISVTIDENVQQEYARIMEHNRSDEVVGGGEGLEVAKVNYTNNETDEDINGHSIQEGKENTDAKDNNINSSPDEINGTEVKSCYLKIIIEDTGIGMTPEEQARIFTRFSQANNRTAKVSSLFLGSIN